MARFLFNDGYVCDISYSWEPRNQPTLTSGSRCKVLPRSPLNKKLKRQGEICTLTGKYRTYPNSSTIMAQVQFVSDNTYTFVKTDFLRPAE